jgi:hypothetical protein
MYSPIYNGGLTNHLPMMLVAMDRLGFSEERIEEIKKIYVKSKKLEKAEDSEYGRKFLELREKFANTDIKDYLSDKLSTMPSGLFHHIIRLYFSLGNKEDEKSALAYFELAKKENKLDFPETEDIVKHSNCIMKMRKSQKIEFESPYTMDKYHKILSSPLESVFRVPREIKIKDMIQVFLNAYSRTKDFYILHVVTGFQALLGLKDYINLDEALKEYYKHAQVFLVLNDNLGEPLPRAKHSLEYMLKKAETLEDAHDIKLLYSLSVLWKYDHNPLIEDIAEFIIKG